MPATLSRFASAVEGETAFTVLAVARRLLAAGKEVIELGDRRQPVPDLAGRPRGRAPGHSGRSYALRPVARPARVPGGRLRVRQSRVRPRDHRRPRRRRSRGQDLRAVLLRGVRGSRRRRPRLQPPLPDLPRQHPTPRRAHGRLTAARVARLPAPPRRRRAVPRRGPAAEGDLPEQPAQPDRRRRDGRRPRGAGGARPGPRRRGVQRRAVRRDGLARPAPHAALRAGHARAMRRRLHVQQVVQHERLAAGLRGQLPGDDRGARDAHQHGALVRAAVHAAGPASPRWPGTARCGTRGWPTSAARWSSSSPD